MDDSSLAGAFLSSSGFLGLDTTNQLQQRPNPLSHQRPHSNQNNQHMQPPIYMSIGLENDNLNDPTRSSFPMNFNKGIGNHDNNVSGDDEPSYGEDGSSERKGKKGSPWQRMKWTDNIVRLLIAVVACVGDDGNFDLEEGLKRKSGALQKKGKWKTVSKIMISKGCCVSPQQCEDKFNDLNKRYKKLNDILGKDASCRVVENPLILDSMRNVSPKMRDDVKKILSSKHLFYQEMCAYHNGQPIPNCEDLDLPIGKHSKEINVSEEDGEEQGIEISVSEDDESDLEDHHHKYNEKMKQNEEGCSLWPHLGVDVAKMRNYSEGNGNLWHQPDEFVGFQAEIGEASENPPKLADVGMLSIKKQLLHLQEQRVSIQVQAFEIEQRSFKWQKFCSKKENELERLRLDNERMRLVNEQMLLQLKHKEMEIDSKKTNHIDLGTPV